MRELWIRRNVEIAAGPGSWWTGGESNYFTQANNFFSLALRRLPNKAGLVIFRTSKKGSHRQYKGERGIKPRG